jgi:hypothetical protein
MQKSALVDGPPLPPPPPHPIETNTTAAHNARTVFIVASE